MKLGRKAIQTCATLIIDFMAVFASFLAGLVGAVPAVLAWVWIHQLGADLPPVLRLP